MASDPKKDEHVLRMVRQNLTDLQSLDCQEPEEPLPRVNNNIIEPLKKFRTVVANPVSLAYLTFTGKIY